MPVGASVEVAVGLAKALEAARMNTIHPKIREAEGIVEERDW